MDFWFPVLKFLCNVTLIDYSAIIYIINYSIRTPNFFLRTWRNFAIIHLRHLLMNQLRWTMISIPPHEPDKLRM